MTECLSIQVRRVCLVAAICGVSWGQTLTQWDNVRKLYVAPLGDDTGASLIRIGLQRNWLHPAASRWWR